MWVLSTAGYVRGSNVKKIKFREGIEKEHKSLPQIPDQAVKIYEHCKFAFAADHQHVNANSVTEKQLLPLGGGARCIIYGPELAVSMVSKDYKVAYSDPGKAADVADMVLAMSKKKPQGPRLSPCPKIVGPYAGQGEKMKAWLKKIAR